MQSGDVQGSVRGAGETLLRVQEITKGVQRDIRLPSG